MPTDKKSIILCMVQLGLVLYMVFSGPKIIENIPFFLIQVFGVLLIGWALLAKKLTITKHHAHLPKGAFLVMQGPYEIIRHPIYAGMLLIMSSFIQGHFSFPRLVAFLLIVVITLIKINHDEEIVRKQVHEYTSYEAKTHKLIPYFY